MRRRSRSSPPGATVTSTAELPCSATPTIAARCVRFLATCSLVRITSELAYEKEIFARALGAVHECIRCDVIGTRAEIGDHDSIVARDARLFARARIQE